MVQIIYRLIISTIALINT